MNWDAVSAIGEILGTLVVFITLGYLTVQLNVKNLSLEFCRTTAVSRWNDFFIKPQNQRFRVKP
ncbi:MAG: hypothetical protein ACI9OF_002088 [Saprospiraceae bacterium]|jgi:hypothetical protein